MAEAMSVSSQNKKAEPAAVSISSRLHTLLLMSVTSLGHSRVDGVLHTIHHQHCTSQRRIISNDAQIKSL